MTSKINDEMLSPVGNVPMSEREMRGLRAIIADYMTSEKSAGDDAMAEAFGFADAEAMTAAIESAHGRLIRAAAAMVKPIPADTATVMIRIMKEVK